MKKTLKVVITTFAILVVLASTMVLATEVTSEPIDVTNLDSAEGFTADMEGIMPISETNEGLEVSQENSIIDFSDICRMEDRTEITTAVSGDLYIMSNSIDISSEYVEGNAFLMGNSVKISGNIYGSVFIMANNLEISGKVENAYILANKVVITETGEVNRDVKISASNFNLKGIIYRNLAVVAENINFEENNLGINVSGNLDYNGKLNIDKNQVGGEINEIQLPKVEINKTAMAFSVVKEFIVEIITALVVIALIVYIANNKYENKEIKPVDYIKDMAWGFVYLIMIPIVSALLIVTIIGLPIGIFGLIIYFLVLYLSIPVTSIEIAKLILKENNTKVKITFLALAVCAVIKIARYVPFIGGLVRFLAILYGIRVIVKVILSKKSQKENSNDVVKTEE